MKDNKKIKPEFINIIDGEISDHLKLLDVLKENSISHIGEFLSSHIRRVFYNVSPAPPGNTTSLSPQLLTPPPVGTPTAPPSGINSSIQGRSTIGTPPTFNNLSSRSPSPVSPRGSSGSPRRGRGISGSPRRGRGSPGSPRRGRGRGRGSPGSPMGVNYNTSTGINNSLQNSRSSDIPIENLIPNTEYIGYDKTINLGELVAENEFNSAYDKNNPDQIIVKVQDKKKRWYRRKR